MHRYRLLPVYLFIIIGFLLISGCESSLESSYFPVIVVHGGAGTILKENMTPETEKEYRQALQTSLESGYAILKNGGSSLDAVQAAIVILEDSPLFNAGKGAVFTNAGTNELDAAIMDGKTLNAGTVAGVKTVKNPIILARSVMDESPHVMLIGKGAETFAKEQGLELESQDYFYTEKRWQQWQKRLKKNKVQENSSIDEIEESSDHKYGTVGCIALDMHGNLAAGTSTGGLTNKRYGRVGDVPIIGAGTYASNKTCAVSATGEGEYFIRAAVAHEISSLVGYQRMSIQKAADQVIHETVAELGGSGGVIVLDKKGNIAMSFNTKGMYRGCITKEGEIEVNIFKE